MTTRICVIGNSHVNALKSGWNDLAPAHPHMELTFFASKGDRLGELEVQDGCLVSQDPELRERLVFTSGGLEKIRLADYDWFVVYGLQLRPYTIRLSLSEAVKAQVAQDTLQVSPNYQTVLKIRSACKRPIVIGHNPLRHTKSRNADDFSYGAALKHLRKALDLEAPNLEGVHLLGQPAETLHEDRLSKTEYGTGATKLQQSKANSDEEERANDLAHMNGAFGALYLERLFDLITRT